MSVKPALTSRLSRRHRNRQIRELTERATFLREKLLENEATIASVDRQIEEMTAGGIAEIEEYVDSLAQLVDADGKMTSSALQQDDVQILERLVLWRWHGVTTVEQANEELAQEVAHRSVGKTDLAVLLSSVDHTAFEMYGTMPGHLAHLHGAELVDAIEQTLKLEDFAATLVQDKNWSEMRRRWIRLGWRNTDDDTFNTAFVRAAAERVAEIHDARDDDVPMDLAIKDTVLDKQLQRVRPQARDQMIEGFRLRLEREYALLPRRTAKVHEVDITLDGDDVNRLDVIADRWDTSREGALDRIVSDAVRAHVPLSDLDASRVRTIDSVGHRPPYSDHELMRRGRDLWDASYAKEATDEQLRDTIGSLNTDSGLQDEVALFAAKWAVHAFQRLMTSHTFAAALMCSDVQRDVLVGIEEQWDAFLVLVPNGMLLAGELEFSRILVATYSFGARMILLTTGGPSMNLKLAFTGTVLDEAPTLADLLVSDGSDLREDQVTQRCLVMAKRLVAGLLLNLQDAGTHKIRNVDARPKSKKREAEPEHRIVTVGAPIEIDCRDAVKEYIERGTRSSETGHRRHGTPTVQWMVRGHFRMQAHGPRHTLRRKTWIRPHWQGQEAALIQTRPSKVVP